jgi:hypothetical protein
MARMLGLVIIRNDSTSETISILPELDLSKLAFLIRASDYGGGDATAEARDIGSN